MKVLKQWILISLIAGVWVATGSAQDKITAPGERPGPGMREGRMRGGPETSGLQDILRDPEMVKALAIDEKQIEKIKALNSQSQKDMIDWNAKLQHAALGLADLMGQEEPNEAAVLKALDESNQIRNEIAKLRVKNLFAVRAILTPEQRKKAKELLQAKMSQNRKAVPQNAPGARPTNLPAKPEKAVAK